MCQAIKEAQSAWDKLNPRYKRLYGARVYTPTHLSPTPEEVGQSPGLGQVLVDVLTKKVVEACTDESINPEYRKLLRGLIGSEITVKICSIRKIK